MKRVFGEKIMKVLAVTVSAGLLLAGCGSVRAAAGAKNGGSLQKVRVGTDTMQLAYAQIIGKQKGFYEENGIDVEITTYAAGIETINAIVTGTEDIGAAYDYALSTRCIPGSKVRMVSAFVTNADGSYWYEASDEDVKAPADLKGKNIGIVKGTVGEYLIAKELEEGGLTADDVTISYLSSDGEVTAAYVAGQIDAMLGLKPFIEEINKAEGHHVINTTGDIGIKSQGFIAADATFASEHPDAVTAYLKGTQKAIDYINSDTDDAAQICADYLTVPKEDVLASFDSFTFDVRYSTEDHEHLQDIADWCVKNKVLENETKIADYADLAPLKAAFPDKVTWNGQ